MLFFTMNKVPYRYIKYTWLVLGCIAFFEMNWMVVGLSIGFLIGKRYGHAKIYYLMAKKYTIKKKKSVKKWS